MLSGKRLGQTGQKMTAGKRTLNKRALVISVIVSVLFSVLCCIGYAADKTGELMVKQPLWWLCMVMIAVLTSALLYLFFDGAKGETQRESGKKEDTEQTVQVLPAQGRTVRTIIITALVLLICWLPVFLAEYPGFFVYDATDEYIEVATRTFTTHHPLLHVLLLGGSVCAGNKLTGSYNTGIAMYTVFQMIVVSGIFGWITVTDCSGCRTVRARRLAFAAHLIWYGFFPTVVMFVLCSAKDTLFSAFMLISVRMVYGLAAGLRTERSEKTKAEALVLGVSLLLMMLMRHNGVYAVAVLMIVAFIYTAAALKNAEKTRLRRGLVTTVLFFAVVIGAYKLADCGLTVLTGADTAENQEILTVPIQQIARCYKAYQSEMTAEEKEALLTYIPEEALDRYTPDLSDPVKVDFNNSAYAADKGGFINIWLKLMCEHPLSYLNAWIDTSYGFYYPWTVVNVYEGHTVYTFTYDDSSYFGYEVEQPGVRESFIPVIDRFYRWLSLDGDIQRIPVIHLFFSMGALFWVYALAMALFIYRKNYAAFTALSLPAGVWLTLLLGPTFLPRYTVFLWFMLPLCLKLAFDTYRGRYSE